jgi:protein-tyrosine phosphatase
MVRIVFVCTGNLCRSVFARAYTEKNYPRVSVSSMGIAAMKDHSPPADAVQAAAKWNLDISRHLSRPLAAKELYAARYIFCMSREHRDYIRSFFPAVKTNTILLGDYGKSFFSKNIPDPLGKSPAAYRRIFARIARCTDRALKTL